MRRAHLVIGGISVAVLALLSVVGTVIEPRWQAPERTDADLGTTARPPVETAATKGLETRREKVEFAGKGTTLTGRVVAPVEPGSYPGVVLVHGAGNGRWTALVDTAEALAERGVVALVYDKRADYTFISHDFAVLAEDAVGGVRALRERDDVDQDKVGLWGFSEGGWVLPLAANSAPDVVDFVMLASPPNVPPLRQGVWYMYSELDRIGASDSTKKMMARRAAAGSFVTYARHDPRASLEQVRQPVLALYGENDTTAPPVTSVEVLEQAMADGGNDTYTVHVFGGVGHELRRADGSYPTDYLPTMTDWLHGLPGTAEPAGGHHLVGPRPAQTYALPDLPETPPYATDAVRYGLLLLAVAGFLVGPVLALVARLRGRRLWADGAVRWWRRRSRRLAGASLGTYVMGFVASGLVLGLLGARLDWGVVATGGWLLTRVLAVVAVVLAVSTTYHLVTTGRGAALTSGQRTSVVGALVGTALLTLNFTYWSMFAVSL